MYELEFPEGWGGGGGGGVIGQIPSVGGGGYGYFLRVRTVLKSP